MFFLHNARRLVGVFVCLLLSACASLPQMSLPDGLPQTAEVAQVPFFPQQDNWCGPASLATLLNFAGVVVTPQQLAPQVYLPGREGTLGAELLATSRRYRHMPYLLRGEPQVLLQELAAGHPVLVLLNLSLPPLSRWHYAVLTGYDATSREFILHSGELAATRLSWFSFQQLWARGQNWAMLVLSPGQLPATAEVGQILQQGSVFEQMGADDVARQIYMAASLRWPDSSGVWFGLGNLAYRAGDLSDAELSWRRALLLDQDAVPARHNLIELLLQLRRLPEAAEVLDQGLRRAPHNAVLLPLSARIRHEKPSLE